MVADIDAMLNSGVDASNDTFIIIASSIYILEDVSCTSVDPLILLFLVQKLDVALRCLNQSDSLEGYVSRI